MRKTTKKIMIGNVAVGGNSQIKIQSMTNTSTKDINATISQIRSLEQEGCEIVRCSVPDLESAKSLKQIKQNISIPLVADIHYDHKLAIEAANYADKIRINPGNIGNEDKIKSVLFACKNNGIPIRIGVNLGSLEKDIEQKYGLTPKAMVVSALKHIKFFEKNNFDNIIVSLKASNVPDTIEANRIFSRNSNYPLHLGVTESGTLLNGSIKSSMALGSLLYDGIGDTIRVSLSADPVEEVKVAKKILQGLKIRRFETEVTSCPTCARANYDVAKIASEIESRTKNSKRPIHIAVMGCSVNGPGEAKVSDIGVVGGVDGCVIYVEGKILGKVSPEDVVDKVMQYIK
jgi:(E)-4-hydroxy-3-methylbut-2-enyl-diphosphate synthase